MRDADTNGFELGDKVKDRITGGVGIITGIHFYMTGCARVSIQPPIGAENKVPDQISADVNSLDLVEEEVTKVPPRSTRGGPQSNPSLPSLPSL